MKDPSETLVSLRGPQQALALPKDFPPLRIVDGQIIAEPVFLAEEGDTEGVWTQWTCGARGWNRMNFSDEWDDVYVYVEQIGWNNGHQFFTQVGPPGGYGGIKFRRVNRPDIWLTARTPETAQRYHGYGGGDYMSTIHEDWHADNSGGYVLRVRKA